MTTHRDDDMVKVPKTFIDKMLAGLDTVDSKTNLFMQRYRQRETEMKRQLQFAHDAANEKDDKVLAALDKLSARIDALERSRNPEPDDADDDDVPLSLSGPTGKPLFKAKDGDADPDDPGTPHGPLPMNATAGPGEGKPSPVAADSATRRRLRLGELQARFDRTCAMFGTMAERPLDGETPRAYKLRMLRPFQRYHGEWSKVALDDLDNPTLRVAEVQILAAADDASRHPVVSPGRLVERKRRDEAGRTITEFFGSPSAWLHRGRPINYVTHIASPGELAMRSILGSAFNNVMKQQQPN
jgi:hypothetical protein